MMCVVPPDQGQVCAGAAVACSGVSTDAGSEAGSVSNARAFAMFLSLAAARQEACMADAAEAFVIADKAQPAPWRSCTSVRK
jgi:hypothetical protein